MNIIGYSHHGRLVFVQSALRGKHRSYCLCFHCAFFHPDTPENCPIAQELFEFDVRHGCTTPMWECPEYRDIK